MNPQNRPFSLLAAGELLVDFIGHERVTDLSESRDFHRYQGGSPANLAANVARLGGHVALVACVGADNLGKYLKIRVAEAGVETDFIVTDPLQPTSLVVVSRSTGTPDFIAYRTADRMLHPAHLPDALLAQSAVFHTTCFALSQAPAQATLVDAARRAAAAGCQVSVDANYAPSLWPDRAEAWRILGEYVGHGAFVKLSDDDAERLYGQSVPDERVLADFHQLGARLICLTKGAGGSLLSWEGGTERQLVPVKPVPEVIDATGAGDAYWAGFLSAWLDGNAFPACAEAGARLAARKLRAAGPLPARLDRSVLYAD